MTEALLAESTNSVGIRIPAFICCVHGFTYITYFTNRFKVQYKRDDTEDNQDGEILLIVPRKPCPQDGGMDAEDAAARSLGQFPAFDQPDGLQPGIVLKQADVDKLTFCCCGCCHRHSFRGCSSWFCKAFPQHTTANQFFTPRMFEAYHREGYRACNEAECCTDWLKIERQQGETNENLMLV